MKKEKKDASNLINTAHRFTVEITGYEILTNYILKCTIDYVSAMIILTISDTVDGFTDNFITQSLNNEISEIKLKLFSGTGEVNSLITFKNLTAIQHEFPLSYIDISEAIHTIGLIYEEVTRKDSASDLDWMN